MKRPLFAPLMLVGGIVLGIVGLILWKALPIASTYPPFLLTPLLAVGYGVYDLWSGGNRSGAEWGERP